MDGGWSQQGRVPVSACKKFTTAPGAAPGVAPGVAPGIAPGEMRSGKCARGKSGVRSGGESQWASTTTIDEVHDQMALHVPMLQGFSFAKLLTTMVGLWISVLPHGRGLFAGRVALS